MKLLIICQYFHPEQFRVNDICFELIKMDHDVTVLTGLPNYPSGVIQEEYRWFNKRREKINGVNVIRATLIGRGQGKIKLALNYISFAISSSFRALFIRSEFDMVLVYQLSPITMAIPALLLKKLTGKPVFLYCHDLWPESIVAAGIKKGSKIYKILLLLSRFIYKQADRIAISSKLFENYFREVLGIDRNLSYLPVYAESLFENIIPKRNKGKKINLVFAGNIGEMQSVETIIKAANKLKDRNIIEWHIVGDGSDRLNCEKLAKDFGLNNVFFYGQRPLGDMPEFYAMADAFLVTLKHNKEISYTLPNKIQSYMAAGKPIIGAIDGETRLVLEEAECGYCCMAEDYITLAELIIKFASNIDKHSELGLKSRRYYDEHFSKDKFMSRLVEFLKINK